MKTIKSALRYMLLAALIISGCLNQGDRINFERQEQEFINSAAEKDKPENSSVQETIAYVDTNTCNLAGQWALAGPDGEKWFTFFDD
ncbi:MAG: hypothetical protein JW874_06310, partial [Spirochaetales bacterium]|nr:hypothetical protein [Spirochaetales bacterium]